MLQKEKYDREMYCVAVLYISFKFQLLIYLDYCELILKVRAQKVEYNQLKFYIFWSFLCFVHACGADNGLVMK